MAKKQDLVTQLDSLAKHNRQGSFQTKDRYYRAFRQFCGFLDEYYHLEKLSNTSGKHLVAYVEYMQDKGLSASTVKTTLAAIRFFHDKMGNAKYPLPDNNELGVELARRKFGGTDRTWPQQSFNKLLDIAQGDHRPDYVFALYMGRYVGLRIHETFRIDTAIANRMLREHEITIKGKGGKIRKVPIDDAHYHPIEIATKTLLAVTTPGHKLLVPDGIPTHRAMNDFERYIGKYRLQIQEEGNTRPMTYHGLRHTYAAKKYEELIAGGMSPIDAHYAVSKLLGHERPDVTNIYIASVRKKDLMEKDGADGE